MMTVPMDSSSTPSSRELAESLLKKITELENGLRRSQQSKAPSDPNAWVQMRENYESIILQDHEFSEEREIELKLWQLHYRRIEEYRRRINAATSAGSNASSVGKAPIRPDNVKKIRASFKTFLTGASGFYHDLLLKIRTNIGLPLTYLNDGSDIVTKDENRSVMIQKGLVSCHRCLIYLGDLARYKGLYGDGDSVSSDYAAASSYYTQSASLCPTNGNPHHQLAILDSYSGNELLAVYRYFRSLAVETPFSTARDNLIVLFERDSCSFSPIMIKDAPPMNRQSFSQLPSNMNATSIKVMPARPSGRGRGRGDTRLLAKDNKTETTLKTQDMSISEVFKTFSTRFVRLNGVLFTRTSLETFGEIFSAVTTDLLTLLSSGPEEKFNFAPDAAENALVILRLIAILIFTVHNVKRESQNQSYAEILQRNVLLQNAFTAAFEFAGSILKRCLELRDIASSSFLPAILVFLEWLASHPDIAAGSDVDEKQEGVRIFFWNQCVHFLNKLIDTGLASIAGDEDETCFYNMNQYDEDETSNRLALMEDFELRGFLPLAPAHLILDFSRKISYENDGSMKDKSSRVERIFSAGRALISVVRIGHQKMFIDTKLKKFVLGTKPPSNDHVELSSLSAPDSLLVEEGNQIEKLTGVTATEVNTPKFGVLETKPYLQTKEEEEEEEIVFKPTISEKHTNAVAPVSAVYDVINPMQVSFSELTPLPSNFPASFNNFQMPTDLNGSSHSHLVASNVPDLSVQYVNADAFKWFTKPETLISDGLNNMNIVENGIINKCMPHEGVSVTNLPSVAATTSLFSSPISLSNNNMVSYPDKAVPAVLKPMVGSVVTAAGATSDGLQMQFPSALPALRKNPVGRPVRHAGPPPGFSHVVSKQQNEAIPNYVSKDHHIGLDDYSWLDGYKSSAIKDVTTATSFDQSSLGYSQFASSNTAFTSASSFPFPGKQVPIVHDQAHNEQSWKDFQLFEQWKPYALKQIHQANSEQTLLPEQHQAQSLWSGRFFV